MINQFKNSGFLPSDTQELLLIAALKKGEDSLQAWHKWKSILNFDDIDTESYRTIPLLYQNLIDQNITDPVIDRYKGIFRRTWYKNQIAIRELSAVISLFHQAGIKTMILKGAALMLHYYASFGLRPMNDFDIFVPFSQIMNVIALLESNGWVQINHTNRNIHERKLFPRSPLNENHYSVRHAIVYVNLSQIQLDIHWRLLPILTDVDANQDFWEAAQKIKIDNSVDTFCLCPTDQLFHVIAHGIQGEHRPLMRWVPDAMTIIASSEIDWERLFYLGKKNHLLAFLQIGLQYIYDLLDAPIPKAILERLEKNPEPEVDIMQMKNLHSFSRLKRNWFWHSHLKSDRSFFHKILTFPRYIQRFIGLKHYWQVPFYFIYRKLQKK